MNVLSLLGYGGKVAVIGMLIVFVGLTILIFAVKIMGAILKNKNDDKKKITEPAPAPVVVAPAPVAAPVEEAVEEEEEIVDDAALIAVISAAIAAFDDSNRLVVRKVRRVSGWNKAAREETVCRF